MRFEPRLIRPEDEPADGLELPDDLGALAEQLSADADFLSARYPAQSPRTTVPSAERNRRKLRGVAAAVLLTGLGLWGGRLLHRYTLLHGYTLPSASKVADLASDASGSAIASGGANPSPESAQLAEGETLSPNAASLFGGLTGAEREGVLDLLEEQPPDEAQLSI